MNPATRILVVDDEPTILYLVKMILVAQGYEVVTATSGDEALQLARDQLFDLFLIDLIMPGTDGIETMLALRSFRKNVAIIAMSGGWKGGAHNCLTLAEKLGASCALAKPFGRDTLVKTVQSILESVPGKPGNDIVRKSRRADPSQARTGAPAHGSGFSSFEPHAIAQ